MNVEVWKDYPIWIQLHNLPLGCWSAEALSKIASGVGIPKFADNCTSLQKRVQYERVLVHIDVTVSLVDEVTIEIGDDKSFQQKIKYEFKPKFCHKCNQLGHACQGVTKFKQVWVPKVPQTPPAPVVSELVTPSVPVVSIKTGNIQGWQAASKVARQTSVKPFVLSGFTRGFELPVREELDDTNVQVGDDTWPLFPP